MTTFGLTLTGFVPKTLNDCKAEMEDSLKASFGQSINLDAASVFGQFVGIMCEREALLWEALQDLDAADDPDAAQGASLDKVCAITGTLREGARYSYTILTLAGTFGTNIPAGKEVSVLLTGYKFKTLATVVIANVSSWLFLHAYVVGERVKNGGNVYQCTVAGTSAGAGGPTGSGDANGFLPDGSVTWRWIGTGTGAIDVLAQAIETGPIVAAAYDLRVIETPVSGWGGALNFTDAVLGSDVEKDPALRARREVELTGTANAALEAIRTRVSKVGKNTINPVIACYVFQNVTMITDVDGLPPKSVEVLVQGGEDADIAAAVFAAVGAGIETYGSTTVNITDSAGTVHPISFSRPDIKTVYVSLWVTKYPADFPTDGEDQLKAAVVAAGSTYRIGKDVTAWAMGSTARNVPGVLDVTQVFLDITPGPLTGATIVCGNRALATFDTTRVVVTLADGSP